ncbi:MAG TPA: endonuclease/exonuclease/phosphatase family protein [Pyrinomonadaceae bacterium]|jgi:endonuclease/exonuclease/phosphatase family metal-dependent hydrolase|nr:endonuclease/exonuclease/phosphatase family protein [Pyrinomonadaceae bacterium]
MWLKSLIGLLFVLSLLGAFIVKPAREREMTDSSGAEESRDSKHLRILTWNIGNGNLESETRAHAEDLPAVAVVILENEPDAVALQELTGESQLKLLLTHLENRYRGYVTSKGNSDRFDAVLVTTRSEGNAIFEDVPAGDHFAAAATFRLQKDSLEIYLVSAHADAFSASRRRGFSEDVTDFVRNRGKSGLTFITGDFNFDVSTRNKNNLFTDDAKQDSESYAYLLKYFRDLGRSAGETAINNRRIDYVFGPTKTVSVRRAEVLRDAAVGAMDHWPLLVEVGF